ncbi:3-phosphoshikimate 1-carboxyvinyltransferase [Alkaliphilus serpentinus]|uniref:3-phosphoshikimate 1-carboxyvinyltransferase n=1 Tax=Alkaliphilus serpentinus TaxID=1482731 RepID=A0A833M8P0_9FIRM|nr:3-phosphoshikimate 1-carboxyvinyltransferase [Alkaliphilus serpentinus]KAB3526739.1 3-phosphoshikimate 1-carboxyvinyltransferase [Alkaliphilus serpentinus]
MDLLIKIGGINMAFKKAHYITGELSIPGDKSISHRGIMLAGITQGKSIIKNFLISQDTLSTINAMKALGVEINMDASRVEVKGRGLWGLKEPEDIINAGNSGTTLRLLSGILAGQSFLTIITGDASLRKRPMARIVAPLQEMGAKIEGRDNGRLAPLSIRGGNLMGIQYKSPISSAQVKSAILMAGLYATGETLVYEAPQSRDHTERMLKAFGGNIQYHNDAVILSPSELYPQKLEIPGDISSGAFFMVAAALLPGSHLRLKNIGLNPTRTGIIDVLRSMGAIIQLDNLRISGGEEIGDLIIEGCKLKGTVISKEIIPRLIDEIPIIAVAAALAEGKTIIRGAEELKYKESNRIAAMVNEMTKLGIKIKDLPDGMEIEGPNRIKGATVESYNDHRVAMSLAICGLFSEGSININNDQCIAVSFPDFYDKLKEIVK